MDRQIQLHWQARAKVIKALAHPTRLFIVDELSKQSRCVCELAEMVGADMSTVSKHLSILKNAGLIEDHKRGVQVWYQLRVPCVLGFFQCVESVLEDTVQSQMELVRPTR